MAKKTAPKTKNTQENTNYRKYISWFWRLFVLGIFSVVMIFLLASWDVFGKLPTFEELENPESNLATKIISADGKLLGTYYNENRTPIKYDDLPQNLVDALVATEDERYYDHAGIDFRGTTRAFAYLGKKGGASTITQQLAKLTFTGRRAKDWTKYFQKIKEWVIATRLERQYTKQEIVAMYLNKQDFLFKAIGISSAARIYFNKEVKDLELHESAVIVAMLKNPRQYNPYRKVSREKSLGRRNQVFKQMEKNGMITTAEKDSLQAMPMEVTFTPEGHADGSATYFRQNLKKFLADWIEENPKGEDSEGNLEYYNIYRDGLTITTTIDSRMQKYAEDAVYQHMPNLQREIDKQNEKNKLAPFRGLKEEKIDEIYNRAIKTSERWRKMKEQGKGDAEIRKSFDIKTDMTIFSWSGEIDTVMTPRDSIRYYKKFLHTGMMSMVPQTGEVRAWVGGINLSHFQYDHVQTGKRQVGSTFKPFLYATAVDQLHISPCDTLPNTLYTIPKGSYGISKDWTPKNAGGDMGGNVTLKDALAQSINTISARLMDKVGPKQVLRLVKGLGIDTKDIPETPAIALGATEISLYEMVGAYGAFANQGVYVKPQVISTIQDKNGTILYQHVPKTEDVLSHESAYITLELMKGVTQSGSGIRLRDSWRKGEFVQNMITGYPYGFTNPIAGKTGTTQNQSDGWFMGVVPNLVTGVWVGGDDRAVHFRGIKHGQGAAMALPIWGLYMKEVYKNEDLKISTKDFKRPSDLSIETDCAAYNNEGVNEDLPDELDF